MLEIKEILEELIKHADLIQLSPKELEELKALASLTPKQIEAIELAQQANKRQDELRDLFNHKDNKRRDDLKNQLKNPSADRPKINMGKSY